jgi:hypothetical protein
MVFGWMNIIKILGAEEFYVELKSNMLNEGGCDEQTWGR